MTNLVDRLLPDALWQRIQPLLPPPPARPGGGVPRRVPDRNCVAALVFMARTSTPWSLLPAKELGCGSASTCWRRLDEWARAGVFDRLQAVLLDELGAAGRIDLDRVCVDSFSLRAVKGGDLTGANPVDRGKAGSKLHLAGDAGGLPLAVVLSAANAHDSTMFEAVLDDIPPILLASGRRGQRPRTVHADKAYDHRRCRARASAWCGLVSLVMAGWMGRVDMNQARLPAIMGMSKPLTIPDRRACLSIIPLPAAVHRLGAPATLAPEQCRSLLGSLARIADPRHRRGRRHALSAVLAVAVAAVLAGARSLAAVGEWASDAPCQVLAALGVHRHPLTGAWRPPGEATVRRVLARTDADALDRAVGAWLAGQRPPANPPLPTPRPWRQAVAVDGKTLRGSGHHPSLQVHLLAVLGHASRAVLAQVGVDAKTNEVTQFQPLLEGLDLAGQVITADAMHAQHAHAGWSPESAPPTC